ncbi:hypothetical protein MHU86_17968 [Fragilaria crotonensis]|nr:hypothetical protein MHU86_17968 [Fragilaria crotonensis]
MNISTSTSRRQLDRAYSLDAAIGNSKPKWRPPTMRTVRFQTNPEIIGKSHIPDAAATLWYTSSELQTIREDVKNTVRELKKAEVIPRRLIMSNVVQEGSRMYKLLVACPT